MVDRDYEMLKQSLQMIESLNRSVEAAHGTMFSCERLEKMTALELLSRLAPNGIRFVYFPEKVRANATRIN